MENQRLYDDILAFDIDGGPNRLSFDKRLARENGWTVAYARRVIVEYKRFVFMTMTAGHVCTPSEQVDQAWHLHLCYTHSYWTRFTAEVLPKPLHHNPTKGGKAEDVKHDDLYKRTLESYKSAFGEAPPADIWPPADQRFGADLAWKRVNTDQHWIVPKAKIRVGLRIGVAALVVAGLAAGCVPLIAQADGDSGGTGIMLFVTLGVLGVIGLIILLVWLARRGSGSSGCSGDDVVIIDEGCSGVVVAGCSGGTAIDGGSGGAASVADTAAGAEAAAADAASTGSDSGGGSSDSGGGGGDSGGGGCGGGGCGGG